MHPVWNANYTLLLYTGRPVGLGRQILLSHINMIMNDLGDILTDIF
jgi:hypothetical protein